MLYVKKKKEQKNNTTNDRNCNEERNREKMRKIYL